jgi:hypothetical protein
MDRIILYKNIYNLNLSNFFTYKKYDINFLVLFFLLKFKDLFIF